MSDQLGPPEAVTFAERTDVAIAAAADALLAVCALQTGLDPWRAAQRAGEAIRDVLVQAETEARNR
jgi:hypothetical protein